MGNHICYDVHDDRWITFIIGQTLNQLLNPFSLVLNIVAGHLAFEFLEVRGAVGWFKEKSADAHYVLLCARFKYDN